MRVKIKTCQNSPLSSTRIASTPRSRLAPAIGLAALVLSTLGACSHGHQPQASQAAMQRPVPEPLLSAANISRACQRVRQNLGAKNWALLLAHLRTVNKNIATHGVAYNAKYKLWLFTGYDYGTYYDWDDYFENIYLAYNGISRFAVNNPTLFLKLEHPDGFIPRYLSPNGYQKDAQFKPFLAQIAWLGFMQRHDIGWLKAHFARLALYLKKWCSYDTDHNGLAYWPQGCDQAGMDNQWSRTVGRSEGVDLNCYLVREYRAMARIAAVLGKPAVEKEYLMRASHLAHLINTILWDANRGFYFDRNEVTGKLTQVLSVSGFTPLWAGVASRRQASDLVRRHLINPAQFWLKYPIASYAQTEPDFYEGSRHGECNWRGSAWIPTNYMIFHGLMRYGYFNAARQLAYRTCQMALKSAQTREYYNSQTGAGLGRDPFWGWSALAYVMPFEYQLQYNPTSLQAGDVPNLIVAIGVTAPHIPGN
ncbi:MAG: MGH1-like glycoside hydrolase domain-containing protein [Phycisphaerae bacterium]